MTGIGLTTSELASIRTDINCLLPDTGYIIEKELTYDAGGGQNVSTSIVAGGTVTYRLDPKVTTELKGGEKVAGGALNPFHRYVLTLPYDAVITTNNQFLSAGGDLYNVVSEDDDKSWIASVRVFIELV